MALIDVRTDIAGNVWKIVTRVGDPIAEGEPILFLESMKMEVPVAAPEAGVIAEILAEEGMAAAEGDVVARLRV
jgi:biotin carboxyl carrier protein